MRRPAAASLPPADLPGLDPRWSRLVSATGPDGVKHTWHLLDSGPDTQDGAAGTLLCVHGNPTWSYLWRRIIATPPAGWRVIAVDQLGMGYSDRLGSPRTLAERIDDLGALTDALGLSGPVITVAHDWGGIISLGWAQRHRDQLAGIILTNTAVHQPVGSPAPALIRLAGGPGIRQLVCQLTPGFVRTTTALSRPRLSPEIRNAYSRPYRSAARRRSVADFVADIPLDGAHPSAAALDAVVAGIADVAHLPVLLLWGPRDPVFSDLYLRDLIERFPGADVHRFEGASHLLTEDRPESAEIIGAWVQQLSGSSGAGPSAAAAPQTNDELALLGSSGSELALMELGPARHRVSFAELADRISDTADQLRGLGVRSGSRVSLLVPPGIDLTVLVYACWQVAAVVVLADAGLGLRGMGRAIRGAGADFVIAGEKGLIGARLMRAPGRLIALSSCRARYRRLSHVGAVIDTALIDTALIDTALIDTALIDTARPAGGSVALSSSCTLSVQAQAPAAVLFTSGATGPAKGVLYHHHQLRAQVELLRRTYCIGADDRLVAAFAPFALYAPALGIASVVPDMDVTAPATLTATALAEAVAAIDATLIFAAPAALRNVIATEHELSDAHRSALAGPRLVLSAGAPVPVGLQRAVAHLFSEAQVHTPYGMTEALPVTDIQLAELDSTTALGVGVGKPLAGVRIAVSGLDHLGRAVAPLTETPDVIGEICVSAAHVKQRYDRLWATEASSSDNRGWHRTGDVGQLDDSGRLWVQGRLRDVISTADGPVTPVPSELAIEQLPQVRSAAVIGVGPVGTQHPVAVLVRAERAGAGPRWPARTPRLALAEPELDEAVRRAADIRFAAVLTTTALPVDVRHNSKIDRQAVARAATRLLSGSPSAATLRSGTESLRRALARLRVRAGR